MWTRDLNFAPLPCKAGADTLKLMVDNSILNLTYIIHASLPLSSVNVPFDKRILWMRMSWHWSTVWILIWGNHTWRALANQSPSKILLEVKKSNPSALTASSSSCFTYIIASLIDANRFLLLFPPPMHHKRSTWEI